MSSQIIIAIETSCDETAIAILRCSKNGIETLTNQISSQVKLHAKWGGVVPNLAAREHVRNFPKLLEMALEEAKITPSQIDLIAVTNGPGLIPALMVGVNYAKTLSYLWEKPLVGIHHIEGHVYANFIGENLKSQIPNPKQIQKSKSQNSKETQEPKTYDLEPRTCIEFPILCLVVSGGHTQLMFMKNHLEYEIIGQTIDDAVGEAFDKVARILGIGYPGGPAVARCAQNFQFPNSNFQTISNFQKEAARNQNGSYRIQNTKYKIQFPRPMLNKKNFNFSFSGLKTSVLYETKKHPDLLKNKDYVAEVCHEFQQACIDVLVAKTIKAAELYNPKTILLAGGVSANKELREQLGQAIESQLPVTNYQLPDLSLTGDNAVMIASAASFRWEKMSDAQKKKAMNGWKTIQPDANLKLK